MIGSFSKVQVALFLLLSVISLGGVSLGAMIAFGNSKDKEAIVVETETETTLQTEAT